MRLVRLIPSLAAIPLLVVGLFAPMTAASQDLSYTTEFVRLRPRGSGILYTPVNPGPRASVAVMVMHSGSDFHDHAACRELAPRGFRAFCANGRYVNQGDWGRIYDRMAIDVGAAVTYLRQRGDIEKVVLVGHSGGGKLMPFYQNVAENGPAVCRGPEKLAPCGDDLAGLPPADGVVLLDAHMSSSLFSYLDPAVTDEAHPEVRDPSLDMYNPANGWDPAGAQYSAEFKQRFFRAQAQRMNRLIDMAQERLAAVRAGDSFYSDTEPFLIPRINSRIWFADMSMLNHPKRAYLVLKGDGTRVVEVPRSRRVPVAEPRSNFSASDGLGVYTLESFLSTDAIRLTDDFMITEDEIRGVIWDTDISSTAVNLAGVHVPTLITAMGAHYFIVPAEMAYDRSPSPDKTMVVIEGAQHTFAPCRACERTPGEFGDTVKTLFDYVADWLSQRYVG